MSCVQKIGSIYISDLKYECNSIKVSINGITHSLDKLISYGKESVILSNQISTFELYTPAIEIDKVLECFSCKETIRLDNIEELKGLGSVINSFNTNSNNSNSFLSSENRELKNSDLTEQLNRIEKEVKLRNKRDYDIHLLILTICLIIIGIIIYLVNSL